MLTKKIITTGVLFLIFTSPSLALNFSLTLEYPQSIFAGEEKEAKVIIKNLDKEDSYFSLGILGSRPEWIVPEKKSIFLKSGEEKSIRLFIKPSLNAYEATYKFRVIVSSQDGERKEKLLPIKVLQVEKLRFSELKLSCEKCEPGEAIKAEFKITNLGMNDREFEVVFNFENEKKSIKSVVKSKEEKVFKTWFNLSKYQPPGEYIIEAGIFENLEKIETLSKSFEVTAVENFETIENSSQGFFERVVRITIENKGNVKKPLKVYSQATAGLLSLYFGPKATKIDDKYLWEVEVEPGKTAVIEYKEFYLYKILAILAVVAVIIYFKFFYVWGVKIRKNVIYSTPVREGDTISVYIEVKASKPLKKIVIKDSIPPSFELLKTFETIKPMKKEKEEEGVELTWKVRSMRAGEERVFHYKMKSKIGIIGTINLPRATVKCEIEGKETEKKSNFPKLEGIKE